MSETKRLAKRGSSYDDEPFLDGEVYVVNRADYPVEVTVRRVPEKVTFLVENGSEESMVSRVVSAVAGCGYGDVRRFRVTVEPLP